jgi:hypothetical protein
MAQEEATPVSAPRAPRPGGDPAVQETSASAHATVTAAATVDCHYLLPEY